jgi:hypothetical protein
VRGRGLTRGRLGTTRAMADRIVYHPGQVVPVSGIYRCDNADDEADDEAGDEAGDAAGDGAHVFESTDVKGHRFPPVPRGCAGSGWVLERASAHH